MEDNDVMTIQHQNNKDESNVGENIKRPHQSSPDPAGEEEEIDSVSVGNEEEGEGGEEEGEGGEEEGEGGGEEEEEEGRGGENASREDEEEIEEIKHFSPILDPPPPSLLNQDLQQDVSISNEKERVLENSSSTAPRDFANTSNTPADSEPFQGNQQQQLSGSESNNKIKQTSPTLASTTPGKKSNWFISFFNLAFSSAKNLFFFRRRSSSSSNNNSVSRAGSLSKDESVVSLNDADNTKLYISKSDQYHHTEEKQQQPSLRQRKANRNHAAAADEPDGEKNAEDGDRISEEDASSSEDSMVDSKGFYCSPDLSSSTAPLLGKFKAIAPGETPGNDDCSTKRPDPAVLKLKKPSKFAKFVTLFARIKTRIGLSLENAKRRLLGCLCYRYYC